MAFEFARKGLSVLLISRSMDKLEATAAEIKAKYDSIDVRVLAIDFNNFDQAARESVAKAVDGMDVGVLVNNVGISYPFTKYFHELDSERVEQLMTLNVNSTTWMSYIVLPGMISRKRGAIVNIGSVAGVTVSPLLAEYGAAKSYVAFFSKAMNVELEKFNIHVQCQVPFFVATKLAKIKKSSLFVASPSQYARAAVASIGFESLVSPFWSHAFQLWFLMSLPEYLGAKVVESSHLDIRKKGMKKEERDREAAAKDKKA
jgi:17beta-estradiol 17-dehydrogenase / very-long-chain 3-oxoacyl-CoA reductase